MSLALLVGAQGGHRGILSGEAALRGSGSTWISVEKGPKEAGPLGALSFAAL